MSKEYNIEISKRFFEAIDALVASNVIRGLKTFANEYNINRGSMNKTRNHPERYSIQLSWISYLIKDFDISPQWMMTGSGKMFGKF